MWVEVALVREPDAPSTAHALDDDDDERPRAAAVRMQGGDYLESDLNPGPLGDAPTAPEYNNGMGGPTGTVRTAPSPSPRATAALLAAAAAAGTKQQKGRMGACSAGGGGACAQ